MTNENGNSPHILTVADYTSLPSVPADHRLSYGDHPEQFGDLYLPQQLGNHPVILLIHGGCWRAQYDLHALGGLCVALTQEGFAVWSIEYRRLGNGGGWPTTFLDVAQATDHLKQLADRYSLDLSNVLAVGHSAGGHLALWAAGRHRLPAQSPLFAADPLPIKGVISLAGVADLEAGVRDNICGDACAELVGGLPESVPDQYAQASPARLLPLGVPHWHIVGTEDKSVPAEFVHEFVTLAQTHDDVHLDILQNTGHFEIVVADSPAWPIVKSAINALRR